MKKDTQAPRDIYQHVTDKLIQAIGKSDGKVELPRRRTGLPMILPRNAVTQTHYNGINIVALWAAAEAQAFQVPVWATYRQWEAIGAQVRRGEKATQIVFYKSYDVEPDPDDQDDDGKRRVAKASWVFNAAQVDNYHLLPDPEPAPLIERLDNVDRFLANLGAVVKYGGDRAYYRPSSDHIQMPDERFFTGTETMTAQEAYYAVHAHEVVHWTGAKHRLARDFGKTFGDELYQREELVAEIGSAYLCALLGITQDVREDHAHYLAHWLELLKSDKKAIFVAAARAAEAVNYLKSLQPGLSQKAEADSDTHEAAPSVPEPQPASIPRAHARPGG